VNVAIIILLTVVLALLQGSLLPFLNPGGVQPDLLLVLVIALGFSRGEQRGAVYGVSIGFFQDLLFGTPPGFFAITKLISGYLSGIFTRIFNHEILIITLLLSLGITIFHELTVVFFRGLVLSSSLPIGRLLLYVILPRGLANMIAMAVVYFLVNRISTKVTVFSSRQ